jgi:hypothetical protein
LKRWFKKSLSVRDSATKVSQVKKTLGMPIAAQKIYCNTHARVGPHGVDLREKDLGPTFVF